MERVLGASPQVASAVARAAWTARCARRMEELAVDFGLEQARAVANVLADDAAFRACEPEAVAFSVVRGR